MPREPEQTSAETAFLQPSISSPAGPLADEGRFLPGSLLAGRYRIIARLGVGGMGEVYRATDLTLGQSVALKFLSESAATASLLERFHAEVRIARQVSHPNVCRVFDIGEAEGVPFISMEYVDGEDLASLLARIGRLPVDKALQAARQICAGLAAAHARGIIHRDLKPGNVMLNKRGEVVIMDFGLAAIAEQVSGAEAHHGTPAYMSPEQLKGIEVTAKSDLYALGLLVYELFTGKRPFDAATVADLLRQQEGARITSMSSLVAEIDPGVEKVVRQCLDPEPARRPPSAMAVAAALPGGDALSAALAAGEMPSPELVASAGKAEGLPRRRAVVCLAAVLVLSVFAAPQIKQRNVSLYRSPSEYPPEVLRQKAREIAAGLGYAEKPADWGVGLDQRPDLLRYLNGLPGPHNWDQWLAAEEPFLLGYREGPRSLVAAPSGDLNYNNPAPVDPGMVEVRVDGAGRLRRFTGVPYLPGRELAEPVPVESVFRAAQFDFTRFRETAPVSIPRSASDQFRAWRGPHPGLPATEVTVEVAWWRGRVTYVNLIWPWTARPGGSADLHPGFRKARDVLLLPLILLGAVFAGLLARSNWQRGRADRRGAVRVAAAGLVVTLLRWACHMHPVANEGMLSLVLNGVADAFFKAGWLWLLYLALEPALRARWPHSIVTWNRLLAGRWRDAQVGAHVLVGATVGVVLWTLTGLRPLWPALNQGLETIGGLYLLTGTRQWMGGIFARADDALRVGLLVFFVIFGLRTLLRRDWMSAIAAAVFMAALEGDVLTSVNTGATLALLAVLYAVLIFALLRLGLVTTIAALFFFNMLNGATLAGDWSTWYAPAGIAATALMVALALVAFRQSLGVLGERSLTVASRIGQDS